MFIGFSIASRSLTQYRPRLPPDSTNKTARLCTLSGKQNRLATFYPRYIRSVRKGAGTVIPNNRKNERDCKVCRKIFSLREPLSRKRRSCAPRPSPRCYTFPQRFFAVFFHLLDKPDQRLLAYCSDSLRIERTGLPGIRGQTVSLVPGGLLYHSVAYQKQNLLRQTISAFDVVGKRER